MHLGSDAEESDSDGGPAVSPVFGAGEELPEPAVGEPFRRVYGPVGTFTRIL